MSIYIKYSSGESMLIVKYYRSRIKKFHQLHLVDQYIAIMHNSNCTKRINLDQRIITAQFIKKTLMKMLPSKTNRVIPTLSYQSGKGLESRLSQSGVYFALTNKVSKISKNSLNMS